MQAHLSSRHTRHRQFEDKHISSREAPVGLWLGLYLQLDMNVCKHAVCGHTAIATRSTYTYVVDTVSLAAATT